MEPKNVKKLVLKMETIANLSGYDQNRLKGGKLTDEGAGCSMFSYILVFNALSGCECSGCYIGPSNGTNSGCPACPGYGGGGGGGVNTDILPGGGCWSNDKEINSCNHCW